MLTPTVSVLFVVIGNVLALLLTFDYMEMSLLIPADAINKSLDVLEEMTT
jgi:hypothetical protein